jgi:hypothetical protein
VFHFLNAPDAPGPRGGRNLRHSVGETASGNLRRTMRGAVRGSRGDDWNWRMVPFVVYLPDKMRRPQVPTLCAPGSPLFAGWRFMPSFAAMIAKVTVEGDTRLHQGFPGFVNGAAERDEHFFWGDPDSGSKLFVRGVEAGSGFGMVLFQTLAFRADHGRLLDCLYCQIVSIAPQMKGPVPPSSYAQSKQDATVPRRERRSASRDDRVSGRHDLTMWPLSAQIKG